MDDPTEQWRPVVGYEGLYEVSNLGRIWSVRRPGVNQPQGFAGGKLRKTSLTNGYPAVTLFRNGERDLWFVHQLVLAAFTGPCPPGQECRHGPNGKLDNRASELSYGTRAENHLDKIRDGTMSLGEANNKAKLTAAIVAEARRRYAVGDVSTYELAREYGVYRSAIRLAITGKTWAHVKGHPPVPMRVKPRQPRAKLTPAIAAECRARYAAGETQTALAIEFGVSKGRMSCTINGKAWKSPD